MTTRNAPNRLDVKTAIVVDEPQWSPQAVAPCQSGVVTLTDDTRAQFLLEIAEQQNSKDM